MAALLTPGYELTLGSQSFTAQVLTLDVRLDAAPLVGVLTATLPAAAAIDAAPGDPVKLSLDGGDGPDDVFTGELEWIRRGIGETRVRALDGAGRLARVRPATTYEQVTAGTMIRNLCGDAGVQLGSVDDGVSLTYYVADPGRTALGHVARLAGWSGALARMTADDKLESTVISGSEPQLALRYGRELLAVEALDATAPVDGFVVAGEAGAGTASAPEAQRPTTDFFAGSRPTGPDATHQWRFEPALRTAGTASTAGDALASRYASTRHGATLQATLLPKLRPGIIVQLSDLPDGLDPGPLFADRVTHRASARGAYTGARLWQVGGGGGLGGSLAGAAGGLL